VAKSIRGAGYVLWAAGALLILARIAGVYMQLGLGGVQDMLSPFNVWNLAALAITFGPGTVVLWLTNPTSPSGSARGSPNQTVPCPEST
jgi:hypothetical protein